MRAIQKINIVAILDWYESQLPIVKNRKESSLCRLLLAL